MTAHTEQEVALLGVYEELAEHSPNEFVRYLAALLLVDEQRHHRIFTQLANTMVSEANLTRGPDDVPPRNTTLWDLLVQLAERDTEKHLLILRFIAGVAKDAAGR